MSSPLAHLPISIRTCTSISSCPSAKGACPVFLEDYISRDPQTGKWSRWPRYFMDSRLTSPLCHAITVDLKAVYEYVPAVESAKATNFAHFFGFRRPVEACHTLRDVLRIAFALRCGESSIMQTRSPQALWESVAGAWRSLNTFEGRNIRDKSLNELLGVLKGTARSTRLGCLAVVLKSICFCMRLMCSGHRRKQLRGLRLIRHRERSRKSKSLRCRGVLTLSMACIYTTTLCQSIRHFLEAPENVAYWVKSIRS